MYLLKSSIAADVFAGKFANVKTALYKYYVWGSRSSSAEMSRKQFQKKVISEVGTRKNKLFNY